MLNELLALSVALLSAVVLTPGVMWLARRTGRVAQPTSDRWHSRPTALLGGVAIYAAFVIGIVPFLRFPDTLTRNRILGALVGATLMFFLGLLDDLIRIKPGTKLIGQVVAACVLVSSGVYFDILGMPLITIPLTIFFVVGITNAFNLLDNMDGLASGVAVICALTVFLFNQSLGNPAAIGVLCLALAGSLLGFLFFNFNPAKIFMGDSGSMFLGFSIAAVSILGTWQQASNTFLILAVPVLLLGLPIFDTTFVTVTRRLSGRRVSEGGKDHTSHRLVELGLSERRAVLSLWAVCTAFSILAVLSLELGLFAAGIFGILTLIVVFLFGVFLSREKIYRAVPKRGPVRPSRARPALINTLVRHKMRMAEVLIDAALFGAAYLSAYLIRFEGVINAHNREVIVYSIPIVIAVKLICFYGFGLYRHLWEFTSIHDLLVISRAVVAGSLFSVFTLWGLTRLDGYSRAVFVLDGILLLLMVAGSRVLFRIFREALRRPQNGRRMLIYGAGSAGEMLLREARSDRSLHYAPVGFLDDDMRKRGRRIHGVKIHGGRAQLEKIVSNLEVEEIVIAIPSLDEAARGELVQACRQVGVACRTMARLSSTLSERSA